MTLNSVNQKAASASGDIAGRDINKIYVRVKDEQVRALVMRLEAEVACDDQKQQWIESLEFFDVPYAPDGVLGLKNKLDKSGRAERLDIALRHKELFVKFLNKWALYGAAQELFALCLHRLYAEFESNVHPFCGNLTISEIDKIVSDKVIKVIVEDYGLGQFALNHGLVLGMTYWLAERCYIRWHAQT